MLGFLACRISFAWGGRGGATVSSSSGNCGMADRMRTSARVGAKSVRTEGAARAWKMIGRRSAFWLALDYGRALFDEFFHTLTFSPKWFVKCGRLSCFWLVSRDGCNELFRQHRFEKILLSRLGNTFATVSCRLAFERALETEKRLNTQGMIGFQCDDGRVHK